MRKIFSYILVALVLFNVLGYYSIFLGLTLKNTREVTHQLDSDSYDESQAITIGIPLTLPYGVDSKDYERVDGEFIHNGQVYRLVKQKMSNDTLFVVCIRDQKGTSINNALTDFVKTFADRPFDSKQSTVNLFSFIKEYVVRDFSIQTNIPGWEQNIAQSTSTPVFIDSFSSSVIHPPEQL